MEKEIFEVIKKNLPAEVGETLKRVLEKGVLDADTVARQAKTLRENESTIENLKSKLQAHKELDEREKQLEAREKGITTREDRMNVWEANMKLAESERRANEIAGFTGMLLKSPIMRKTIIENDNVISYYDNGHNTPMKQGSQKTIEKTQE